MKKLLIVMGLVLAVASAHAQSYGGLANKNRDLLDLTQCKALYVTNTIAVTNLALPSSTGTNVAGMTYTNLAGTRATTTASVGTNINFLSMVELPPNYFTLMATNHDLVTHRSQVNVSVDFDCASGAGGSSTGLRFTLSPSWDGQNVDNSGAFDFVFLIQHTASSRITTATNAPTWLWAGAKAVALTRIVNTDTDATSQAIVRSVRLNGWGVP